MVVCAARTCCRVRGAFGHDGSISQGLLLLLSTTPLLLHLTADLWSHARLALLRCVVGGAFWMAAARASFGRACEWWCSTAQSLGSWLPAFPKRSCAGGSASPTSTFGPSRSSITTLLHPTPTHATGAGSWPRRHGQQQETSSSRLPALPNPCPAPLATASLPTRLQPNINPPSCPLPPHNNTDTVVS